MDMRVCMHVFQSLFCYPNTLPQYLSPSPSLGLSLFSLLSLMYIRIYACAIVNECVFMSVIM